MELSIVIKEKDLENREVRNLIATLIALSDTRVKTVKHLEEFVTRYGGPAQFVATLDATRQPRPDPSPSPRKQTRAYVRTNRHTSIIKIGQQWRSKTVKGRTIEVVAFSKGKVIHKVVNPRPGVKIINKPSWPKSIVQGYELIQDNPAPAPAPTPAPMPVPVAVGQRWVTKKSRTDRPIKMIVITGIKGDQIRYQTVWSRGGTGVYANRKNLLATSISTNYTLVDSNANGSPEAEAEADASLQNTQKP